MIVASQTVMLDAARLRGRRLELGISARDLANHVGVTYRVINQLERDGNPRWLPLTAACDLARCLGLPLQALFLREEPDAVSEYSRVAKLGAVLLSTGALTAMEDLARAFGWSLTEVAQVADALGAELAPVGMTLVRQSNRLALMSAVDDVPDAELLVVKRGQAARFGMRVPDARMVADVAASADGIAADVLAPSLTSRMSLSNLVAAGLLRIEDGRVYLTDDVRFSISV